MFSESIRRQTAGGIRAEGRVGLPLTDGDTVIPVIAAEDMARAGVEMFVGAKRSSSEKIGLVGQQVGLHPFDRSHSPCS
jgi:hypothetical protein